MLLELDYSFFSNFIISNNNRNTCHEHICGADTLLVTIGDSWTWGDSLDGINLFDKIDSPKRLVSVYGYHLKNLLNNCDWINIAYPGTANQFIVDSAERFIEISKKTNYKKIILSVGLTDYGRDVWPHPHRYPNESIHRRFISHEAEHFKKLSKITEYSNINVIVGRNFTNTFLENTQLVKHLLPNRWVDVSAEHWKPDLTPPVCYSTILKIDATLTSDDKQWLLDNIVPGAESMIKFLNECPLHYKKASKHPNEQCHQLWANYIYNYIVNSHIL